MSGRPDRAADIRLRTTLLPRHHDGMDPELGAIIAATARLDLDVARARLCLAAGGSQEEADAIMQSRTETDAS